MIFEGLMLESVRQRQEEQAEAQYRRRLIRKIVSEYCGKKVPADDMVYVNEYINADGRGTWLFGNGCGRPLFDEEKNF